MSKQPRDDANAPIPVLSLRRNGGHIVPFTLTANSSAQFASDTRVVSVYTTANCFIEIGPIDVQANSTNSHFLPAEFTYDYSLGAFDASPASSWKYISVVGERGSGILYISERV